MMSFKRMGSSPLLAEHPVRATSVIAVTIPSKLAIFMRLSSQAPARPYQRSFDRQRNCVRKRGRCKRPSPLAPKGARAHRATISAAGVWFVQLVYLAGSLADHVEKHEL